MTNQKPYFIAITGGTGAGKTHFIKALEDCFDKNQLTTIAQDNYYLPEPLQPKDENGVANFDTLESMNFSDFYKDLEALKAYQNIERLEYTYNHPDKIQQMLYSKAAPIIVVDGIFLFHDKVLSSLFDLKIFIELNDSLRLKRRILRDFQERGYDLDDVLYRFENHAIPAHIKLIEPFKHEADIILPNTVNFDKIVEMISIFLKSKL